jgi:hypothetical protein
MHVDLSFSYLRSAEPASFDKKEFRKYLCIFSVFIYAVFVRQYFWRNAIVLKPRFKIDVVIMIICSIVIIINSVLTLSGFDRSFTPRLRALRNEGCVHPHLIRFIPASAPGRIGCAYA